MAASVTAETLDKMIAVLEEMGTKKVNQFTLTKLIFHSYPKVYN